MNIKTLVSRSVLVYLRFFARHQLKKNHQAITIGITGSSGKTSTRLALAHLLSSRGVVKHSQHANSESGIPLNILGLTLKNYNFLSWLKVIILAPYKLLTFYEHYDFYIVEMGIDSPSPPKNMDYLLSIIKPDMAIILGASLTHAANFDYLVKDSSPTRKKEKLIDLIAQEKMKLAQAIATTGTVVINQDNLPIMKHTSSVKAKLISFGYDRHSLYRLSHTKLTPRGFSSDLTYLGNKYQLVTTDPFGIEYSYTFAAAFAMAHALGVSISHCQKALKSYRAPAGRMRVFEGVNNTHIIDSSYNASPATISSAIKTLDLLAAKHRRIVVVGDMRELGVLTKQAHQDLARLLSSHANYVLLFGPSTKKYTLPILTRLKFPVYHAPTMSDLTRHLRTIIKPHDWILIKGSQNTIYLERAVESILANPKDKNSLARRGQYWDQVRSQSL